MALNYKAKNLLRVATGGDNVSQDHHNPIGQRWVVLMVYASSIYLNDKKSKFSITFFSHEITISGAEDNKLIFTVKSVLN